MDNAPDAKSLADILIKIAENCTSNLTIQQYVFLRIEEVLGLSGGDTDALSEDVTAKRAVYFGKSYLTYYSWSEKV